MKQLLEIFTDSLEDNIYASMVFSPLKVTFLVDHDDDLIQKAKYTAVFLENKCQGMNVEIVEIDFSSIFVIDEKLHQIIKDVDCIDITGGEDRIKVPLLKYAIEHQIQCSYLDIENENIILLNNDNQNTYWTISFDKLDIEQILYLAGATSFVGNQDFHKIINNSFIDQVVVLALKDANRWKRFSRYISYINAKYSNYYGDIDAPRSIKLDGRKIKADISMFNTLAKIGALINLEIYDDRICFNYYDETIENLINQQGSFLEVYTYLQLYNSKQFDEIKINTIIDWDKDDENKIINEVDVIARIGRKLYFISCKTSELKTEYLNEIYVITKRFGLKESFPVIVTTTDIDERTSLIYERARKLDCIIIDKDDIKKGNLVSKLLSVY